MPDLQGQARDQGGALHDGPLSYVILLKGRNRGQIDRGKRGGRRLWPARGGGPSALHVGIERVQHGTALEIANKGLAMFGGYAYRVDISAPGHLPRRLTLVANSAMPQRVHVDLVPIRQP